MYDQLAYQNDLLAHLNDLLAQQNDLAQKQLATVDLQNKPINAFDGTAKQMLVQLAATSDEASQTQNTHSASIDRHLRQLELSDRARLNLLDPIDRYIVESHRALSEHHFHFHYQEWRMRRIRKVLELYDSGFKGKKILELGGGHGDIGAFFASLGAEVVSADARHINHQDMLLKFRNIPGFHPVKCDLEEDFTHLGRFDLIINFGFIEMVRDVDLVVDCCARMTDDIFLETMCCDSLDSQKLVYGNFDPNGIDHPLHGESARPSPAYLERLFEGHGFAASRHFDSDLNVALENPDKPFLHLYDWDHQDDGRHEDHLRRFWRFTRTPE